MRTVVFAALAVLGSACFSRAQPTRGPDKTFECNVEQPTGTNIPRAVCRSERQRDEEREAAQEAIRRMQITFHQIR